MPDHPGIFCERPIKYKFNCNRLITAGYCFNDLAVGASSENLGDPLVLGNWENEWNKDNPVEQRWN
jgi:hypothetical protein